MATTTTARRFSQTRLFDNTAALFLIGVNGITAVGTGLPIVQVAAAAVLPGAFEGIRRTFRTVSGVSQEPLTPLMRGYVIASSTLLAPIANSPSILQYGGLSLAVGAVAAVGMGFAVTHMTRPSVSIQGFGQDNTPETAPVIDLSAEPETRPYAPGPVFRLRKEARVDTARTAAPEAAPEAGARAPEPAITPDARPDVEWEQEFGR